MKKILFEGTELSGKSDLINEVALQLARRGCRVQVNAGQLNKQSSAVTRALAYADRANSTHLREFGYTWALLLDSFPENDNDFFIQERSFPSVIAFSQVFNPLGINRYFGRILARQYPSFDYNFFVTASLEARRHRLSNRPEATELDSMVLTRPDRIEALDRRIRRVLSREPNYHEIDTTFRDISESAHKIVGIVL
ncbi:MAG: hypothetical protein AABX53_04255 [Nanoarchaeota archaeon]